MNTTMEIILKIAGAVIALAGLAVIYGASKIVKAKNLDEKKKVDPERTALMDEEQLKKYKHDAAVLDVKIKGVLVALPGFIILLVMFRI